jgi:hypothetical protein
MDLPFSSKPISAHFPCIWKVGPEHAASVASSGVGGAGGKLCHSTNVADDAGDKS